MSYRLPRYRVSLVREGSCVCEQNAIRSPEDVFAIMEAEYANSVVETANMLALDTKNRIIGVFEISTGSLNASIIHPRDVISTSDIEQRCFGDFGAQPSKWRSNTFTGRSGVDEKAGGSREGDGRCCARPCGDRGWKVCQFEGARGDVTSRFFISACRRSQALLQYGFPLTSLNWQNSWLLCVARNIFPQNLQVL